MLAPAPPWATCGCGFAAGGRSTRYATTAAAPASATPPAASSAFRRRRRVLGVAATVGRVLGVAATVGTVPPGDETVAPSVSTIGMGSAGGGATLP